MATVRDLYTQEGRGLSKHACELSAHLPAGNVTILQSVAFHDLLASEYRSFYIDTPPDSSQELITLLMSLTQAPSNHGNLEIVDSHPAQWGECTNRDMHASRNIVLYVNRRVSEAEAGAVLAGFRQFGKNAIIRDVRFSDFVTEHEKPAAFISHDSRDKGDYAGPLAAQLSKLLVPIWYDEYSVRVGDNIYQSIENGMKNAAKVIVLLSKNFLGNASWARQEFLMAIRQHVDQNVLLPVWIDVDADDVKAYDLTLAGLHALKWSIGIERVAAKLAESLRHVAP